MALVGHLDTVFPPGTFEGYRRDGDLARGPGVLDMKGGLVVIAFALKALAATGGLEAVAPVRVVIVSDEEVGSPEGQGVIGAAVAGSGCALVFEAGRKADAIITRRKGTGGMTVVTHGKAAHAGNAHKDGANAIWTLARFVDAAQALTSYDRGVTVNVGRVSGGTSKNTVPEHAEAQLDLRFCTRVDGEALVAQVRAAAERAAESVSGTRVELHGGVARLPLERTDASGKLLAEYAACARAHGLGGDEAPLIGGGSDASTDERARHPVHRRHGPARHRLPHQGRAHRGRHPRPQGAGPRAVPGPAPVLSAVRGVSACYPHADLSEPSRSPPSHGALLRSKPRCAARSSSSCSPLPSRRVLRRPTSRRSSTSIRAPPGASTGSASPRARRATRPSPVPRACTS